ncbi:MAG: YfhO family protein [Flavobacteriales bacterium]|nr:YfhO family protein [Flavobacteriales bacterium]
MEQIKKLSPHLIVILLFVGISFAYFSPVMQGKVLDMPDIKHWKGMSKEVQDFREDTGEEALWTNSMFSGMPAYQISTKSNANLIQYVVKAISLGIPRPANLLFLYLLGFYLLLLSLKVDYRLSAVGAIAFAFSSYFFIIIMAGHMTKAHAIAYVPMVVAAVLYTYRGRMILGGVLTALAVALELYANHLQITYYLVLVLILIGVVQFVKDLKANNLTSFAKRSGVLVLAALLASGTAVTRLSTTMEYGTESTRGKSELTTDLDNKTSGLDKDYATSWSYGIAETFTLLIPNFYGGASQGSLTTDSETYQAIKRAPNAKQLIKQLPLYWGAQPFTSGPTYAGAIVMFLFIFGLLFVKSEIRVWILLATIMSIMLAWGKNFMPLTDLFLDYFPGYNKFRAVSMILVIAEFTLPLLGFVALNKFLSEDDEDYETDNKVKDIETQKVSHVVVKSKKLRSLNIAFYIAGGITLVFALMPNLFFDFVGGQDDSLAKSGWPVDALQSDRAGLLSADAWRSFIFIALTFGAMWMFLKNKLSSKYAILIVGVLVLADMWTINKRYLNDDNFVRKSKVETPYQPTQADNQILNDKDPNFRVYNQSVSTFNDASTSYFHKSIGGYHGAKLKRYQELIGNHISKGNMAVLNMLNTKYFINPKGQAQQNPGAMGNAWFINEINTVANADAEIASLNGFNPANTAIVDVRFSEQMIDGLDNVGTSITLAEYKPNYLKYNSTSSKNGIAIFSEIYYDKGWNAYVDGELKPHFRANYVLRGMQIPAGTHVVEFKFEPAVYHVSERIALASSIILLLLLAFVSTKELKA